MDIKELKASIMNKNIQNSFIIFKYTDNDFLPLQYLHEIRNTRKCDIQFIDRIQDILSTSSFFFEDALSDVINVFICDVFDVATTQLKDKTNLIVITKKISDECSSLFKDYIVEFPKLEEWQLKDYAYSLAPGVSEKELDGLIRICNKNIYRLDKELKKIKIFTESEQKYTFKKFVEDGIFDDLSDHNIFDFCSAILKKDISSLTRLYSEISKIDVEPLGLVKLLYDNLRTIISIQLDPSATAELIGIAANRFWAIKKNSCGYYTKDQLLMAFYMITDIDRKLKSGEITTDIMIDYIVCHMLSF